MKKTVLAIATSVALALSPSIASADPGTADANVPVSCADLGDLTILATTDNHGTALNYDYFTGNAFGALGEQNDARGLELLAPAIAEIRAREGADSVLLVDNGDSNQGNPLETVYHKERAAGTEDPLASVANYLQYDVGVVGNHEWNYGLEDLQQYKASLNHPLLGANAVVRATGEPYLDPYTMITKTVNGEEVKIGVIGVVTPGVRIWDGPRVKDLEFQDQVNVVKKYVPIVKEAGADVVVVLAHTGEDPENYVWNPADLQENASRSIAENTTGVDVIIGGHSHVEENFNTTYRNADGESVLVSQPGYHARFLSEVSVPLTSVDGQIDVVNTADCAPSAQAIYASDYVGQEDPGVKAVLGDWHQKTLDWVATIVAQATETMPASESAWEDTPIVDFINHVQTETVEKALVGTEYEGLPVISEASPFSRTAVFNEGDVTIADMAALYIYDNTLFGSLLTGAQVKDYLEWSARYYIQQEEGADIDDWSTVTNAMYEGATRGIMDYAYDILSGVNYHINISKPVGERIENLTYPDGTPVGDDDQLVLAVNNYRQSGGSGYPHVTGAPIVYDEQMAVRDLMIDWAVNSGVIDPADFFVQNWTVSTSSVVEPTDPQPTDPQPTDPQPSVPGPDGEDNSASTGGSTPAADSPADDSTAANESAAPGALAKTGASVGGIAAIAALMLVAGGVLVGVRRRSA